MFLRNIAAQRLEHEEDYHDLYKMQAKGCLGQISLFANFFTEGLITIVSPSIVESQESGYTICGTQ